MSRLYWFVVIFLLAIAFITSALTTYLIYQGPTLLNNLRESRNVVVEMTDTHTTEDARLLLEHLNGSDFNNPLYLPKIVDKEQALNLLGAEAAKEIRDLGIDNPLRTSITFRVVGDYINTDSLRSIAASIGEIPGVESVHYRKPGEDNFGEVGRYVLYGLGLVSIILLPTSILLLYSMARRNMDRVTYQVINNSGNVELGSALPDNPLMNHIGHGAIAAILGVAATFGMVYLIDKNFPSLGIWRTEPALIVVLVVTGLAMIFLVWLTLHIATLRYLRSLE